LGFDEILFVGAAADNHHFLLVSQPSMDERETHQGIFHFEYADLEFVFLFKGLKSFQCWHSYNLVVVGSYMNLLASQLSSFAIIGIFHFGENGLVESGNFCCHVYSEPFFKGTHFLFFVVSMIFVVPLVSIGFVVASYVDG
jgi:hypothetical protein